MREESFHALGSLPVRVCVFRSNFMRFKIDAAHHSINALLVFFLQIYKLLMRELSLVQFHLPHPLRPVPKPRE